MEVETEEPDPRLFQGVVARAKAWGVSGQDLSGLTAVRRLSELRTSKGKLKTKVGGRGNINNRSIWKCFGPLGKTSFGLILVAAAGLVLCREMHTLHGFSSFWLEWLKRDPLSEKCTIEMPTTAKDVFRPPVDCSMCHEVDNVEKVSQISSSNFKDRYAYSGRPVVIRDGAQNWTALTSFTFGFFKTLYGDDSPVLDNTRRDCQFFPYQTQFRTLADAFNMSRERALLREPSNPWYIGWSNCDSTAANLLRQHYTRPYFLPSDAESSRTDWIFMGSPGYGADMHIDHVGYPSWQAQITGSKRWTLEPPPECYHECQGLEVTVEPGEIFVLDTNWWYHKTEIVGSDMSITIGSEYD